MSFPEISRRCLECGASMRAAARFCPQCGREAASAAVRGQDAGGVEPPASDVAPEPAPTDDAMGLEESWRRWEQSVGRAKADAARERPAGDGESGGGAGAHALRRPAPTLRRPPDEARLGGGVGETDMDSDAVPAYADGEQKGSRAAAVREAVRPRVERVREASMGVLEGAAEDSGLRFVLIAVGLFLLFLLFLLLSYWLK